MLDHLFVDLITHVQDAFDRAFLERLAVEERFQVDVFLGDVTWEASYSLPGEDQPPRVQADLRMEWPTWSQTAYRIWTLGETPAELPEAMLEIAMRVQRLADDPGSGAVLEVLPRSGPSLGAEPLARRAVAVEEVHAEPEDGTEAPRFWGVEGTYEATVRFEEKQLEDPAALGPLVTDLTRWVSSTLVRLADLPLTYLPPDPADAR